MPTNIYTAGIHNVGSYQVAGIPYLTSSAIVSQEKRFSFPFVCKSITIHNTGSYDIYFRFSEDVDAHFKLPSSKIVTLDTKASAIFVSGSTATGIQLYASLTNLDRNLIPPEATLFSTASEGGGAPLPAPEVFEGGESGGGESGGGEGGEGGEGSGGSAPTFNLFSGITRVQQAAAPAGNPTDLEAFLLNGVTATPSGDGITITSLEVENINDFLSLNWAVTGSFTINIKATDSATPARGSDTTRNLQITQDQAPVLDLTSLGSIELGTATATVEIALSGAIKEVTDDVDGTIPTGSVTIEHDYVLGSATHGSPVTASYTVTDSFGNTTTEELTTTVQDTVAPAFNSFSDLSFVVGASPSEEDYLSGVSATDLSSVTLSVDSTAEDTSATGTYTIQITATDAAGNATTVSRTVNITNAGRPVIYPNRIADSSKFFGGLVAGFGNYLVNSSNGGKQPPVRQGDAGVYNATYVDTTGSNGKNLTALHSGTQARLELTGTAYGNAATASFTFNSEFTSNVLELDGTGDYIEFPEVTNGGGGMNAAGWNTNFVNGDNRYDLGSLGAYSRGNTPHGNRYCSTLGWFKLDNIPNSGHYTIMNKRDSTTNPTKAGYDIKLQFRLHSGSNQARIIYTHYVSTNDGQAGSFTTSYKDVSTDLWYMFRITSREAAGHTGDQKKLKLRAALWAQNETGSAMLQPTLFSSITEGNLMTSRQKAPLRIGSHVNDGQAFNGKFFRIYRWYALEGSTFDQNANFSSTSFAGGMQDSVVGANMNLDNKAAIKASSTDTFADPGATAVNGETVYSNWETVMGSANGPYGSTTPNLSTQGGNKYYLIEYSASNGEGTGYAYRVVRIN